MEITIKERIMYKNIWVEICNLAYQGKDIEYYVIDINKNYLNYKIRLSYLPKHFLYILEKFNVSKFGSKQFSGYSQYPSEYEAHMGITNLMLKNVLMPIPSPNYTIIDG